MAHLEYPKHVYKGEGDDRVSRLVANAEQEAEALEAGFEALPSAPPAALPASAVELGSAYLEFPKHVYREDESRVVQNAAEEAAAADEGFAPLVAPVADEPAHDEAPKKSKRGKK